jgi:hypothetical protein
MLLISYDINKRTITKRSKSPLVLAIDFFNSMGTLVVLCQEGEKTKYTSILTVKKNSTFDDILDIILYK